MFGSNGGENKSWCKCCDGKDADCRCPHHWLGAHMCIVKTILALIVLFFVFAVGFAAGRCSMRFHGMEGARGRSHHGWQKNGDNYHGGRYFNRMLPDRIYRNSLDMQQYWRQFRQAPLGDVQQQVLPLGGTQQQVVPPGGLPQQP